MEKKTFSRSEQIKALTHPLRLRLMDLLRSGRELTATEAAELTGESVASCSFHLRQLAKFGVVEQAERRGREKPWKARDITLVLDAEGGDREDLVSAMAGARALLQQSLASLERFMAAAPDEDPEWVRSSHMHTAGYWMTRDEYAGLADEVQAVLDREQESRTPETAPEGSRFVRFLSAQWVEQP